MKAERLLPISVVSVPLVALMFGTTIGCDTPTRGSTPTTPSLPLPAEGVPTGPTGLSGTWDYTMELLRQSEPVEMCGLVLNDPGRPYEGRVHVQQTGSSIDIGCGDGDEATFGTCIRGQLDGNRIAGSGGGVRHHDAWCTQYPLFHDIDWTIEATVESETAIRGTMAGRFSYMGSGPVIEIDRVWTLVLRR